MIEQPQEFLVQPVDASWLQCNIECQEACPVGTNCRGYLNLAAEGRFEEGYILSRDPNPVAAMCSYVCSAPCERACRRGDIDRPLAIRARARLAHALMMAGTPRADILAEAIALDDQTGGRTFPSPRTFQAKHLTQQAAGTNLAQIPTSQSLGLQTAIIGQLVDRIAGFDAAANPNASADLFEAIAQQVDLSVAKQEAVAIQDAMPPAPLPTMPPEPTPAPPELGVVLQ